MVLGFPRIALLLVGCSIAFGSPYVYFGRANFPSHHRLNMRKHFSTYKHPSWAHYRGFPRPHHLAWRHRSSSIPAFVFPNHKAIAKSIPAFTLPHVQKAINSIPTYMRPHHRTEAIKRVAPFLANSAAYTLTTGRRSMPAFTLPKQPIFSPLLNGHMKLPLPSFSSSGCAWDMAKPQSVKVLEKALEVSQTNISYTLENIQSLSLSRCRWCNSQGCSNPWHVTKASFTIAKADNCDWTSKCDCKPIKNDWAMQCTVEGTVLFNSISVTNFTIDCKTTKPEKKKEQNVDTYSTQDQPVSTQSTLVVEEEAEEEEPKDQLQPEEPRGEEEREGSGANVDIINIPSNQPLPRGDKEPEPDDAPPAPLLKSELKDDDLLTF